VARKSRHVGSLRVLRDRYFGDDPVRLASLEKERLNARIARQLYDLRVQAGLTQRQLASLVGTTASVICQLEDSDYSGRSLSMLHRIASALSSRIDLRFVPVRRRMSGRKRKTA
jgi:DNA-binding XRE family transcriptional regulator